MQHIVLLYFDPTADPAAIERFLELAPDCLAGGPFLSHTSGLSTKTLASSADWGFIAEVDDPAQIQAWVACDAHKRFIELLENIVSRSANFQVA